MEDGRGAPDDDALVDTLDEQVRDARVSLEPVQQQNLLARLRKQFFGAESEPIRLDRFVLLDRLGQGGSGVVYSAYDPELDRRVALKLLRSGHGRRARERLLREARALARLSHPNVVPIHDVGTLDGRVFIVMEFVMGQTLRGWGRAEDRSWQAILDVYRQAGQGLVAAHAAGLVHRDFKPANALIGDDGRVRVLDFGLARGRYVDERESSSGEVRAQDSASSSVDMRPVSAFDATVQPAEDDADGPATDSSELWHERLTLSGTIMGTPAYMSPEQIAGIPAGPTTDQFSFCASLYEGLYGQRPFDGDELGVILDHIRAGRIREPDKNSDVPGWLHTAVCRGLAADPGDRYVSMQALVDALARDPAAARRRRLLTGGALLFTVLAVSALLALGASSAVQPCQSAPDEIAALWNDDRRATLERTLFATGRTYAAEATPLVVAGLDAYANQWVRMHEGACMAHQQGIQSGALLDKRMACLSRRRDALASAIDVLSETDSRTLTNAVDMVQKLPLLGYCANIEALEAENPPPEDPESARLVARQQQRLAHVRALDHNGRYEMALRGVKEVISAAEVLAYRPLLAEALTTEGRILINKRLLNSAIEPLHRAMSVGFSVGAHRIALEALALRIYAIGTVVSGPTQGLSAYVDMSEALIQSLPERTFIYGLLLNNIGATYFAKGDHERARVYLERALTVKQDTDVPNPIELALTMGNLAMVIPDERERTRQFTGVIAVGERELGPAHPLTLTLQLAHGRYTSDPRAAHGIVESTCTKYERQHPDKFYDLTACLYALSHLHLDLGDERAAADALSRVERLELSDVQRQRLGHTLDLASGYRLLHTGAVVQALEQFQAIVANNRDGGGWWVDNRRGQAYLGVGLSLSRLGRVREAIDPLERALGAFDRAARASRLTIIRRLRARASVALARALWDTIDASSPPVDGAEVRARALDYMERAEAWYRAAATGYQHVLRELAEWRRTRGL